MDAYHTGAATMGKSRPPSERNQDEDDSSTSSVYSADHQAVMEKQDAMAYLLRYETMVRQQEAEDMAVIAHLRPCVQRLLELLGQDVVLDHQNTKFLQSEISFEQLKLAYDILLQQQNEFMTTDRQFMMVLKLLTQKVDLKQTELNASVPYITWAEVIQCYKVCVSGMLTLQHSAPAVRSRTRDRTLALLSLFEAPSTQLFHQDANMLGNQQHPATRRNDSSSILDMNSFTRSRRSSIIPRGIVYRKRHSRVLVIGALVAVLLTLFATIGYGFLTTLPKAASSPVTAQRSSTIKVTPRSSNPFPKGKNIKLEFLQQKTTSAFAAPQAPPPIVATGITTSKQTGPLGVALQHVGSIPKRVVHMLQNLFQWIFKAVHPTIVAAL